MTVLRKKSWLRFDLAIAAGRTTHGYRDLTDPQERPGYADAVAIAGRALMCLVCWDWGGFDY